MRGVTVGHAGIGSSSKVPPRGDGDAPHTPPVRGIVGDRFTACVQRGERGGGS